MKWPYPKLQGITIKCLHSVMEQEEDGGEFLFAAKFEQGAPLSLLISGIKFSVRSEFTMYMADP